MTDNAVIVRHFKTWSLHMDTWENVCDLLELEGVSRETLDTLSAVYESGDWFWLARVALENNLIVVVVDWLTLEGGVENDN